GIESIVDADDPRLASFYAAVNDPQHKAVLDAGASYHREVAGMAWAGPFGYQMFIKPAQVPASRARKRLEGLVKRGPEPYKRLAGEHLKAWPKVVMQPGETILKGASDAGPGTGPSLDDGMVVGDASDDFLDDVLAGEKSGSAWRLHGGDQPPTDGWMKAEFMDLDWKSVVLPAQELGGKGPHHLRRTFVVEDPAAIERLWLVFQNFEAGDVEVFLNGRIIMVMRGGGRPDVMPIPLKLNTRELLKKGTNCLAMRFRDGGQEGPTFNIDLRDAGPSE
ncbi:MAG: hypothetical protein R3336_07840, partial [Phycisphaeraceae bacterium]|nr:hypothetical protein [Phycisphaeraceae bacterium]